MLITSQGIEFADDCGGTVVLKSAPAFGTGKIFLNLNLGGGRYAQTVLYVDDLIGAAKKLKETL